MGAFFSKENWEGVGFVVLATVVGVIAGQSFGDSMDNFIVSYLATFAATFFVVLLLSIPAYYYGTRKRCEKWPPFGRIAGFSMAPGLVSAISTTVLSVMADFVKNPVFAILFWIAKWTVPIWWNFQAAVITMPLISCG